MSHLFANAASYFVPINLTAICDLCRQIPHNCHRLIQIPQNCHCLIHLLPPISLTMNWMFVSQMKKLLHLCKLLIVLLFVKLNWTFGTHRLILIILLSFNPKFTTAPIFLPSLHSMLSCIQMLVVIIFESSPAPIS